jgi:phosphoglycolate phosphatase
VSAAPLRDNMPWSRATLDGVLVDLDGTMVDTLGDFTEALQRMLCDLPAPFCDFRLTPALVESFVGKGADHLIKSLLAHVDAELATHENVALIDLASASYQGHYQSVNGRFSRVYPGVAEGLGSWQAQGLKMACVTNKPTAFARTLLADKGLAGYFSLVVGGDTVARKKPDPMPLLHACSVLGIHPARTLMVGDSVNDAQAARAAGCPVLLVSYGYNHGQPIHTAGADAVADSLIELLGLT